MYIHVLCFFCQFGFFFSFFSFSARHRKHASVSVADRVWDAVCELGRRSCHWTAYQWAPISQDGSDLHQTAVSGKKGREGSLSLAAAFTLSSRASWRGIWNVSIDIPMVFVASVRQPGSANHNNLFTCIEHWQWCHRMTKSVYVVCQVCVCVCIDMFFLCVFLLVCMPLCLSSCVCVCVLRPLGSEWEQVVAPDYRSSWQQ